MPDYLDEIEQQILHPTAGIGDRDEQIDAYALAAQRSLHDSDVPRDAFHGPLQTVPDAEEVNQVVGNHLIGGSFTLPLTGAPMQIAWPSPYCIGLHIYKTVNSAVSIFIGENPASCTIPLLIQGGFGTPLFYAGPLYASSAGGVVLGVFQILRTPQ